MTVRNIHTREGYDIWDKLCAIPCYGFLLAPEGSRVVKAEGIGNWIDKHAAQEVVDQAQSELNELRAALAAVTAERDRLARDLAFTEQWYAVRFERLAELGKSAGCWDAMAAIIANGTADSHEPPTYARQLVRANHRADVAERERDRLRAEVERLRKERVPAGLYRELVALRELRNQAKAYIDGYLLDEIDDVDCCVSEDQHLSAAALSRLLQEAISAQRDAALAAKEVNP